MDIGFRRRRGARSHPAAAKGHCRSILAPGMASRAIFALPALPLAAALAIGGCASFNGAGLLPGKSTEAEVVALMGEPSQRGSLSDGDSAIYFSRLPYGRNVYVVTVGPDGVMKSIEQRLTLQNLAKIAPQAWTRKEVRELFGPPGQSVRFDRLQREVWTYRYHPHNERRIIHVQFSDDGVVREVLDMIDPEDEMKRNGRRGGH